MRLVHRTALVLALAAVVPAVLPLRAALAKTQEAATPEARFAAFLEALGAPGGVLGWSGVDEDGGDLRVSGLYFDLASFGGEGRIAFGDVRFSAIRVENGYVTAFRAVGEGIDVNLAELSQAGRAIATWNDADASFGLALAMGAGFLQGIGYSDLRVALDYDSATDLSTGIATDAWSVRIPGMFDLTASSEMTGVTPAYIDWVRNDLAKLYLDSSPMADEETNRQVQNEDGPYSGVGYSRLAIAFDDQGIMPKFEPYLADLRVAWLGLNPDGTPKTELSDAELEAAAASFASRSGLPATKLLPVVKAGYRFLLKPDVIRVSVRFQPAITLRESGIYSTTPQPLPDLADRIIFEASN